MAREKVFLVIVEIGRKTAGWMDQSYLETKELVESAGGTVVGSVRAFLPHPSSSHLIREGKLSEIQAGTQNTKANLIVFNQDLSAGQARNIEEACSARVVDRTGLILDIFARRARSREGRLQVELAQLTYLMPRLIGQGAIMSRLGGGIGTRGPGEQKLEVDRRKIRQRIQIIKRDLEKVSQHRALIRSSRRQKQLIQISLVGYTNAGKSTLLNALTGTNTYTADQLFATLDPLTRRQSINGRHDVLITDTVGFIRDLPPDLLDAFHATLEEVSEADLLIHVLDVSDPHFEEHKKVVEGVLKKLKAADKPFILALNKADLLTEEDKKRISDLYSEGVFVSALHKKGLLGFMTRLDAILDSSLMSFPRKRESIGRAMDPRFRRADSPAPEDQAADCRLHNRRGDDENV